MCIAMQRATCPHFVYPCCTFLVDYAVLIKYLGASFVSIRTFGSCEEEIMLILLIR